MNMNKLKLTPDQVIEAIAFWQPMLGIDDWEITFKFTAQSNMERKYADIEWFLPSRRASMRLVDPETWAKGTSPTDMETSIVHELWHVANAGLLLKVQNNNFLTDEEEMIMVEQPTECIADSLVRLRRHASHRFSWEQPKKRSKKRKSS